MILCKNCGYEGSYISKTCPSCNNMLTLDKGELALIKESIAEAKRNKESETVSEAYHILAEFGDTDGEREWAKILEQGDGVPEDIDAAMDFYRKAAEKSDPFSAYKYSELLYRTNEVMSRFWLEFSAFIGYPRAYLDAAKSYLEAGEIDYGNHYSYLAAVTDDTDAIVFLAERYSKGDGVEESQEYAKWYLDKLTFPPLYAFKLSFKLRSIKPAEAPNISMSDRRPIAMDLINKAKKLNLPQPLFYLYSFLFESGKNEVGADLGELYLSGCGTEQNTDAAIRTLTRAAATGNANAYMKLGKIYYEGIYVERSFNVAIKFLENAGKLGIKEAYTLLGDIYSLKDFNERNIPTALSYYEKGSEMGDADAKAKADKIIDLREKFYREAIATANTDPKESFKNRIASAAMGHPYGKLLLAEAYAEGLGTKPNRRAAFSMWKSASDDGNVNAFFPLGLCYAYGFGTDFNFKKALGAFSVAEKNGIAEAKEEINRLIENKKRAYAKKFYSTAMRLIYTGKFEVAVSYLEVANELSYPKATYTLGCLYEFAKGVALDKSKAYSLYAEADKQGFFDDRSKYKHTILKMLKK